MKSFTVNQTKKYEVVIDNGWKSFPKTEKLFQKVMIITDQTVASLYLKEVAELFDGEVYSYVIPSGERSKNLNNYCEIVKKLYDENFSRTDLIVALGGGVVGDLAGFVAATFMRGVCLYQIPTTIVSVIDSSVGGKTALDIDEYKNAVGVFYAPSTVYVNLNLLKSLPKREVENGYGELIKYSFLSKDITAKDGITEDAVYNCLKYKSVVVSADEFDNGLRRLLNLGHTVGHAIESASNYSLPHGVCVYNGLFTAIEVSAKLYGFSSKKKERLLNYLKSFGLGEKVDFDKEIIFERIKHDKKKDGDRINYVCIYEAGDCRVEKIPLDTLRGLL